METIYNVLLAEDLPSDAELSEREIRRSLGKCNFVRVETKEDFTYQLINFKPDIVISDYKMPNFDGLTALKITIERSPLIPFIIVTGSMNEDTAVECMKAGATDYVLKEHISRLGPAVVKALEQKIIQKEKFLAELALRESEERFRSVAQSASDAILVADESGMILSWNNGAKKIFGYSDEEIIGKHLTTLMPTQYIAAHRHIFTRRGAAEEQIPFGKVTEMVGLRKDGREFPFELSISMWQSGNGNFLSAIIRDITQRKEAEATLVESEKRYRSLFENMLNGFAYCRMIFNGEEPEDFVYLEVNNKFEELTGLKNVVGKKVTEIIPGVKENDPELFEIYGRVALTGRPVKFETYMDSLKMWFSISVYSPHKEYFVVIFDVITERKLGEAALKESEQRYRTFINSSSDMIFLKDESFHYAVANHKLAEFIGKEAKDVLGKTDFELLEKEYAEATRKADEETIKTKATHVIEMEVRGIHLEGTIFPVELVNGKTGVGGYVRDITKRKKAEQRLAEERILTRTLINNIPDAIYVKDSETKKVLANPADLKNIGKSESEVMNKSDWEVYPEEVAKGLYDDDMNVLNGNAVINREEMLVNTLGEINWLLTTKVPIRNDDGKIIGLVGIGRNITDRKKTEDQLRKLNLGIEQSPAQIMMMDVNGIIEYVNPKFRTVTGYSDEEIIGRKLKVLNPKKEFKAMHDEIWNTILSGREWNGEIQNKKKNGELYWEFISISPIKDGNGKITNFVAISEDVTERKKYEDQIIMLYKAIEQSKNVVIITNPNGDIEYVNPQFTKLTGYTSEEVLGENPRLLNSGKTSSEQYKELWNTIRSGHEWSGEFYNKKKNGEYFWESANISPVRNEAGTILHFIAVKEDITERKSMIDELRQAKEKAEEVNRLKSIFFANMSHELRTPFVGILGFSEILKQTLQDPDEREMAEAIHASSQRLTGTLNEILNLTKLELDKTEIENNIFDVNRVVSEVHQLFSEPAQQKGLHFTKQTPEKTLLIKTDERLFREVLTNLVHNAVKFTAHGEIDLSAKKILRSGEEYLVIKIKDTGIGIPHDKQKLIWEEFRQVSEGLNRSFEGSGLGLTIAKKYVGLMGGKISVESEIGKGSTFIVELPMSDASVDSRKSEGVDKNKNDAGFTGQEIKSSKILVIDDDKLSRDYVNRVLSKYHELDLAENAENALAKIHKTEYDAIIMDINLGHGMDGLELTQKIRKMPSYTNKPIIAMTAYAASSDQLEFLSKGVSHYLSKPFTSFELYKTINEALKKGN